MGRLNRLNFRRDRNTCLPVMELYQPPSSLFLPPLFLFVVFSGPGWFEKAEMDSLRSHLLDPSLPKRRGRPSNAVVAARTAMVAAQAKAQVHALKKHQLALDSSSSSEDDIDDLSLVAEADRICRTKLGFEFDLFSSDDDPFRSMPSTSQLLIQDDNVSFTPSPHKLSWEDSPITYPDDDYPYQDAPAALVTRSGLGDDCEDQDQSAPMDLEEVLDPALLLENDTQTDGQVPHNLKKWDIIPPNSFRSTREPMDLPTFSPRRYATKSLQRRIIMSVGSYYPSYPAHPHHHLHHHHAYSNPHPSKPASKTRPLPPPLLALPASKFRGPGMYPGIVKRRPDNHHP